MIKILKKEFLDEDGCAVCVYTIHFLGIKIITNTVKTTNQQIVNSLKTIVKKQIKGFNNETKDFRKEA